MKNTISLLIMCKDEFIKVKNIIKSLENVVNDVVVVVTGNTIVKSTGTYKILYYPWHDDYSAPLNAGLRLCASKWIFRMDTDEEIDDINKDKIVKAVNNYDVFGFNAKQRGYLPNDRKELGVKRIPPYKGYNFAVDDKCCRLFRNDPRIFYEFNTHETIYNSLERCGFELLNTDLTIHHWGKLDMEDKAPYYYQLAKERLIKYPEDYQSYYYLGVAADFIGNKKEAYNVFKKGFDKYQTNYYKIPMEFLKQQL